MRIKLLSLLAALMLAASGCTGVMVQNSATAATATSSTAVQATNAAPPAAPPNGAAPGAQSSAKATGAYTLTDESATETGKTYTANAADESAIYVTSGGTLTATNATISSSGDSSSSDSSSFYGLNAVVLVEAGSSISQAGSSISLADSTVSSTGAGANGVFATGEGATVDLANVKIDATGQYAHAVMATLGGVMTLANVDMTTAGANSGAIATDRGGGTIDVTGGTVTTTGQDSPGIYSTGTITVSNATVTATGAEAAVIEGANKINLVDTDLSSSMAGKWGVMIYQSMSGDAEGTEGQFSMTGGSLAYTAAVGPLFYVTNSTGGITLSGVDLTAASGVLAKASADRWGAEGANGGNIVLTADNQVLGGDLQADAISTLAVTLQNGSTLTGAINADGKAQAATLTLDGSSSWTVTADSYLTCLSDAARIDGTSVTNITGNGHTVYYDAAACGELNGATYDLAGGGTLTPAG
ncbi:MAG: hypothetical protein U0X20_07525 [Caldilineaceae bacterium]